MSVDVDAQHNWRTSPPKTTNQPQDRFPRNADNPDRFTVPEVPEGPWRGGDTNNTRFPDRNSPPQRLRLSDDVRQHGGPDLTAVNNWRKPNVNETRATTNNGPPATAGWTPKLQQKMQQQQPQQTGQRNSQDGTSAAVPSSQTRLDDVPSQVERSPVPTQRTQQPTQQSAPSVRSLDSNPRPDTSSWKPKFANANLGGDKPAVSDHLFLFCPHVLNFVNHHNHPPSTYPSDLTPYFSALISTFRCELFRLTKKKALLVQNGVCAASPGG